MRHIRQAFVALGMAFISQGLLAQEAGGSKDYSGNWMGRIPDNTYVAALSIPGSHDSSTGSGWVSASESLGEKIGRAHV